MCDLSDSIEYNPSTGEFRWKLGGKGRRVNSKAGTINSNGYYYLCLNSKRYLAHRAAIYLTTGEWPNGDVDHINGDKLDNRISNLRVCTKSQNQMNRKAKGYSLHKRSGLYQARIGVSGKEVYLGWFEKENEARAAYEEAQAYYHKEYKYKGT